MNPTRLTIHMRMFRTVLTSLLILTAVGCGAGALEPTPACDAELCAIRGRVEWLDLEGGFWAIRGDDQVTYEPLNLPPDFRHDGLRVRAIVRIRRDVGTFRMVGPVVEVLSIRRQ